MFDDTIRLPLVGISDTYQARPLAGALASRQDLKLVYASPGEMSTMLDQGRCDCALLPPAALLTDARFMVLPGSGVVAHKAAVSERLITTLPLEEVHTIATAAESEHLCAYVNVLFAERGLPAPTFVQDTNAPVDATLISGDAGLTTADGGYDLGTLWFETTELPMVLGAWVCAATAPYRRLRQLLGEAGRDCVSPGAAPHGEVIGRARSVIDAHYYYRLLSLESDSLRRLHALAVRHAICETSSESIAFC